MQNRRPMRCVRRCAASLVLLLSVASPATAFVAVPSITRHARAGTSVTMALAGKRGPVAKALNKPTGALTVSVYKHNTYICTCIRTHINACLRMHTHTHVHTCVCTHIHTADVNADGVGMHTYMHASLQTFMLANTRTCTHAHMYTLIYVHICSVFYSVRGSCVCLLVNIRIHTCACICMCMCAYVFSCACLFSCVLG